ncbi:type I restriction enzyme HsdR N-terminal domain-containing protein [Halopenitus salinus]|uniref:Type I restriction enzyme HsdR N-terminal domain-containing protein n=1 Tax=Halopenitus salinus TaxID=1198295 RepID=A0ABD5UPU1_9EURY
MDKEELVNYVDQSKSLLESSPQMDEQNTRRKLIEPLLELLGWDMLSSEVELEYSVQMGVGTKKVDYALELEDAPVVFVEAKGADTAISSGHRDQLTSYMRQTGVDWGMLTNGTTVELYKRKQDSQRPDEIHLGNIDLNDLPDRIGLLRAFSRDSIASGESETIAENVETTRRAADQLRENKAEISTRIAGVVTDEIGDAVSQTVQDGAKQFVDVLASSLERQGRDDFSIGGRNIEEIEHGDEFEWTPGKGKDALAGTIARADIPGPPNSQIAIFPTRISGIQFLKENNAWGFVRVGQDPDYAAFYVAGGPMEIQYIASIKEIVPAEEATLARDQESYIGDEADFDPGDQVVIFEPGSLYELEDPIRYKNKAPQGRVYTDLKTFKNASTTEDVI